MTGARFVHDTLERCGWEVLVADAQKVKGLAPLACKTDRIDARVLAELSRRDLVPAIWLPSFEQRGERERARWRLHLVKHRTSLKLRVHATLMSFGHRARSPDLFGRAAASCSRGWSSPSRGARTCSRRSALIDELDREIAAVERELQALGRRPSLHRRC